ncbi:hypothetical protein RRG08_032154 [Elysia crispata]|uniref:Uncharacterized protein n=1 Tax=Elysia crispata TaxID=231223 RepID=A0AAE1ABU4_9GAST|nr:hypothetical protein RRG08_032154 [Elysia crispata]
MDLAHNHIKTHARFKQPYVSSSSHMFSLGRNTIKINLIWVSLQPSPELTTPAVNISISRFVMSSTSLSACQRDTDTASRLSLPLPE